MFAQSKKNNPLPKPKNGNTYVVAHRGAHNGIPENTLAAYKKAIELGCDYVEIDVRSTKDVKFVSVHDATIDAYVEGKTGKVDEFTLAELKQLNIGKRIGPTWENERIPTFEEILQLCKGEIGIYLDLKENIVPELVEIIKKHKMERSIIWYVPASFIEPIKQLQILCDKCVPMPDPGPKENISKIIKEIQPIVIATGMNELNEEYIKIAHGYNIKVIADEQNGNTAEWTKMIGWGTDGIQTDHPEALIKFLRELEK